MTLRRLAAAAVAPAVAARRLFSPFPLRFGLPSGLRGRASGSTQLLSRSGVPAGVGDGAQSACALSVTIVAGPQAEVLPAASVASTRRRWGPSASCAVSSASVPLAVVGQGTRVVYGSRQLPALSPSVARVTTWPSTSRLVAAIPPPLSVAIVETRWTPESVPPSSRLPAGAAGKAGQSSSSSVVSARQTVASAETGEVALQSVSSAL